MANVNCVVCHHKGNLIVKALESLEASLEVDFNIIVATSDHPNNVAALKKKFPKVKFLEIAGGPAHKRNVASRFADGEFIAFFDDDVEVTPYALFYMREELCKKGIGMVFGKLLNMEFRNRFDEAGSYLTSTGFLWARCESGIEDKGQFDSTQTILAGKSASCMIRRKVFWEVFAFDPSYEILGEETDLAWRVWLSGWKVLYVPSSVTYHAFNTKFKPSDFYIPRRVYFNGCRNYISMLLTNLGDRELALPILCQSIVWFMAGCGMLVTGKFEAGTNIFKGLLYVLTHLKHILSKRRKVQGSRKVSDRELMPLIRKNPPFSYYTKRFFHYIYTGRHG